MATKTGGKKNSGAAADLLSQIGKIVPTTAKPKSGKVPKWEMVLTPQAQEDAKRWVAARTVQEVVDKRVDNAKAEFNDYAIRIMAEKLFASKSRPSNPLIVLKKKVEENGVTKEVEDHQFQFTFQDRFTYNFKEIPDGVDPRDHFIKMFTEDVGLHPAEAEKFVDNELEFTPVTGFRNLSELMEGKTGKGREFIEATPEQQEAGRKLAALALWDGSDPAPEPLTPEEKGLVFVRKNGLSAAAGFYDRVATYCQNVDQLMGIFKIVKPIAYPVYAKFAMNDSPADKTRRLIESAADILGTATFDAEGDDE